MRTLIVARHGESEYSARGLLNGDPSVQVGLTEEGDRQAQALCEALRDVAIDLCVTTQFPRTQRTAELALHGRGIPVEIWADLNDPLAGSWEGQPTVDYLGWASEAPSFEPVPGGGHSRHAVVTRCARAYRALLERPEGTILAVLHALPIAYLLGALDGSAPEPRMRRAVLYAEPYPVAAASLAAAVNVLEGWCAAPGW